MADETNNEGTPKADSQSQKPAEQKGSNTLVIVGVVALLAIGGLYFYNQMTQTNAEKAKDAMQEEVEDVADAVEEGQEDVMNEAEDVVNQAENVGEESMQLDEERVELRETVANSIVNVATEAKTFTTLLAALKAAGLDKVLSEEGEYTVFAPNDAAFEKLPAGTIEALLADPKKLADVLKYHVVSGKIMAEDLQNGQDEPTLQGAALAITVNPDGTVEVDKARVIKTDVDAANGVIHVIDTVLIPAED